MRINSLNVIVGNGGLNSKNDLVCNMVGFAMDSHMCTVYKHTYMCIDSVSMEVLKLLHT